MDKRASERRLCVIERGAGPGGISAPVPYFFFFPLLLAGAAAFALGLDLLDFFGFLSAMSKL